MRSSDTRLHTAGLLLYSRTGSALPGCSARLPLPTRPDVPVDLIDADFCILESKPSEVLGAGGRTRQCWSVGSVGMTECWEQPGLVMVTLPPVSVLLVFSGSARHLGTTGRTWWENDPSGGRHFWYLMPCRLSSSCIVKHGGWTCECEGGLLLSCYPSAAARLRSDKSFLFSRDGTHVSPAVKSSSR